MRMDFEAVMAGLIERLAAEGGMSGIRGELTGDRQAGRAQIQVHVTANGEERCFRYHIRREAPVHTIVRSMAEDTIYTLPQRVFEGVTGRLQPNDVYYPTALGNAPTHIPGQPSAVVPA
ncbi:MAG TPA: hypothetical protein VFE42_08315 [Chloroflexota bacterium]|nr:hypothetical protein [Chloroflexota bacterium]